MAIQNRLSLFSGTLLSVSARCLVAGAMCLSVTTAHAEANPKVLSALSQRHFSVTAEDLERTAGGRDALISDLLQLRTYSGLPYVGPRAAKLLLEYADQPQVQEAIQADFKAPDRTGLARVYAVQVDKIRSSEARASVARMATTRAADDADFVPYAKSLLYSSDDEVKRVAREVLR